MKAYMAFDCYEGPEEGASLVFHNTAKEAKVLAWQSGDCLNVGEYIDIRVTLIKDKTIFLLANQEKLFCNKPHVVNDPPVCKACELWGCGINPNNTCAECNEYAGDELVRILTTSSPPLPRA